MNLSSELIRYTDFFKHATGGCSPIPYQTHLATNAGLPSLLDVPTGLGKTAAAILAWTWRRRFSDGAIPPETPRRLVYCLPMRVLVEQTFNETVKWLARLGLLAGQAYWTELDDRNLPARAARLDHNKGGYRAAPEQVSRSGWATANGDKGRYPIAVHLLLGGGDPTDWALWPERDSILIGTQDMLLSRALNRGYSAGRARWPLEFGLLNNDCLWVFDEIQLMDTGLATSLQLDAWRDNLLLRNAPSDFPVQVPNHGSKPCRSLWMSATMARHWLEKAIDWSPRVEEKWKERHRLTDAEQTDQRFRSGQLFRIQKQLVRAPIVLKSPKANNDKADVERKQKEYLKEVAKHVCANRAQSGLTLIIVNTVDRATELFELLRRQPDLANVPIRLVHARFRPLEREQLSEFLNQRDHLPRILVSTQVVEAGVDLSASVLYIELAPWASLVQRFGRCARYPGESGRVFWFDLELGSDRQPIDRWARPYNRSELIAARKELEKLKDVGLNLLTAIKDGIDSAPGGTGAKDLFPYEPRFVPRDKDLFDLFDTTPDLTGADVDISRFIRDGDELDVQVFWRAIPAGGEPVKRDRPQRLELCSVQLYRFRESLAALRKSGRIWRRNYRRGWEPVGPREADEIYPGQVYLLEKSCGGYSPILGWTGDPRDTEFELPEISEPTKVAAQDEEEEAEDLSQSAQWLTILDHTRNVCRKLDEILRDSDLPESDQKLLRLAARWHDRGKAHVVFQDKLKSGLAEEGVQRKLAGEPAAKAPEKAWSKNGRRRGFRHELASSLAILEALRCAQPTHGAFAWPDGLSKSDFEVEVSEPSTARTDHPLVQQLAALSADELDLLVYLVAAHHGKVRMSIRSSPDDERSDVPDPCPEGKSQARGVRDGDALPSCEIPGTDLRSGLRAPEVALSLDLMELGLSPRYGASWRERMQFLLERLGPFRLAYLEGVLRAADCRASTEEDQQVTPREEHG